MRRLILLLGFSGISILQAEEFAGEIFALDQSVAGGGSASAFPSTFFAPSRFLQFPGDVSEAPRYSLEAAMLPMFGGLSQAVCGAGAMNLESGFKLSGFTSIVSTPDIPVRPLLAGTPEERQARPDLRPDACAGCALLRDQVYLGMVNAARGWEGVLPRTGLENRPIPFQVGAGVTAKYFWEELEGGDYMAQNLNLDVGASLRVLWDYNPASQVANQIVNFQVGGFEVLPTNQRSDFGGRSAAEAVDSRWHFSLAFEQGIPHWRSTFAVGAEHRSEADNWPALGAEWRFSEILALRTGWDQDFLTAGFTVRYRWLALHYALRRHELGTSLYQVSLQVESR